MYLRRGAEVWIGGGGLAGRALYVYPHISGQESHISGHAPPISAPGALLEDGSSVIFDCALIFRLCFD